MISYCFISRPNMVVALVFSLGRQAVPIRAGLFPIVRNRFKGEESLIIGIVTHSASMPRHGISSLGGTDDSS